MRRSGLLLVLAVGGGLATPLRAQTPPQNVTLRQALQAYDNVDFARAIALARRALLERMSGPDQARAYELLGFGYSATDSQVKAVDAFKQTILLDPDRELDPRRISPKITSLFYSALGQVLVVRQLKVDSARFVGGQGSLPIRFTVTSPARVRTRAVSGAASLLVDSAVVTGTVNVRRPARLPNGDPVLAGDWLIVVDATAGQNSFSASQPLGIVGGAALVTGFVMMLRKPAARAAQGNILYKKLLHEQVARRNQDIAKENVTRRQQVQLTIVPLPKPSGAAR